MAEPRPTIGILGGGQLGRMLAQAATGLGIRSIILCPDADCPAAQVADAIITAPYKSEDALKELAGQCVAVTYEFENIPATAVDFIAKLVPVRPNVGALRTSQNRIAEKGFLIEVGVRTTPFKGVLKLDDVLKACRELGLPAVLKTRRMGYDGKGQAKIETKEDVGLAWRHLQGVPAIFEAFVDFKRELSILCARSLRGDMVFYPVVENTHRNHILHQTHAPAAGLSKRTEEEARDIARRIANGLDYIGVIAIELFETSDGGLLVNEIAPRVHNSGHWTIEACETSQFENHIRAVMGMPLGSAALTHSAVMTNLIGDDVERAAELEREADTYVHLYGKAEAKPGRKMGHVTKLAPIN